jgi:hypothetical protein
LIDKHSYPKDYFFSVTRDGIDGRHSLLLQNRRHRQKPKSGTIQDCVNTPGELGNSANSMTIQESCKVETPVVEDDNANSSTGVPEVEMEDLSKAVSALQFVPSSVRFGRGGRAGFAKPHAATPPG